jgi:DNA polymerase I
MKVRGVMARKGDTPEYVRKMQHELFDVLSKAKSQKELWEIEPRPRRFARSTCRNLMILDMRKLATIKD